jgi:uncharacterized protein YciI
VWYLVLSRRLRSDAEAEALTPAHRDWLDDQHRSGRLLFSGPSTDGTHGIYIVLAASQDEAERIAAEDPYHVHGIREAQMLEWRAHRAMRLAGPTIEEIEAMARNSP